jgi:hypothetical protein
VWVSDIFEFLWYYCQPDDNFTVASHADDEQHLKTYGNNVTEQREEEKGWEGYKAKQDREHEEEYKSKARQRGKLYKV